MEILNVGIGELILIGIIALLVFGPERLPEIARQAARLLNQVRGATDEIQRALLTESKPLKDTFESTKRELTQPVEAVKREIVEPIDSVKRELEGARHMVERNMNQALDTSQVPLPPTPTDAPAAPDAPDARPYKPLSRPEAADDDPRA